MNVSHSKPLPESMIAIEISQPGGPEVLKPVHRPLPVPGKGEVLIHVASAGVNRPDCLQRAGAYPPPPGASDLPGLEVAGTIVALGESTEGWALGDAVCALTNGGGYAQYCATPAGQCLPVPDGLDWVAAAALPETFFTVWTNLFQRARLVAGESLLVHGGSSGIGTTAIQLAHAMGIRVFTTVGNAAKAQVCRDLGADTVINYREADFVDVIMTATERRGVNVILDMVGGDYVARNLKCLALEGRLVQIAFQRGSKVELDLMSVMLKRQTITGSTLRARPAGDKADIAQALRKTVWPLIASGRVRPVIDRHFALEQADQAHAYMESGEHIGKIMLTVG